MTKVLVCGGRRFTDREVMFAFLDKLHAELKIDCLIHGAARGADSLAGIWAFERQVSCTSFPADWALYGRAAGSIRNQQMLDEGKPDAEPRVSTPQRAHSVSGRRISGDSSPGREPIEPDFVPFFGTPVPCASEQCQASSRYTCRKELHVEL